LWQQTGWQKTMACNSQLSTSEEDKSVEEGNEVPDFSDEEILEGQELGHRFSEPWEDSDVILVVKDEKFHVHRLILSINSPVFKAMFKSEFKEATANEVLLPDKKANEVLDFLKQLYLQEREEITMDNVQHLLKLSDEYQVKAIFEQCVKFLENQPKTEENVMTILMLASLYRLDNHNMLESCYTTIREMKRQSILKATQQQDLDQETMQNIMSQRFERLETCLEKLYPHFIGVLEYCFSLWYKSGNWMKQMVTWCPLHFTNGKLHSGDIYCERLSDCPVCKQMLLTITEDQVFKSALRKNAFTDDFDEDLSSLIQDFSELITN